jgi:hypothetical protein
MNIFKKMVRVVNPTDDYNCLIVRLDKDRIQKLHITKYSLWVTLIDENGLVEENRYIVLKAERASNKNTRIALTEMVATLERIKYDKCFNERSLLELLTFNGITALTADIEETRERGYSYDLLV